MKNPLIQSFHLVKRENSNTEHLSFHFASGGTGFKHASVVQVVHSAVIRSVQPNSCPWDSKDVGVVVTVSKMQVSEGSWVGVILSIGPATTAGKSVYLFL